MHFSIISLDTKRNIPILGNSTLYQKEKYSLFSKDFTFDTFYLFKFDNISLVY